MASFDTINYLKNGERANETNLNRPLKDLVTILETKFQEIENNQNTQKPDTNTGGGSNIGIPSDKIENAVTQGMVVYLTADGKLAPALADGSEKESFVGIYMKSIKDSTEVHTLYTSGNINVPSSLNLKAGKSYYLSDTTPGQLVESGKVLVGKCLLDNTINLVQNSGNNNPQTPTTPQTSFSSSEIDLEDGKTEYSVTYTAGKTLFFLEGVLLHSKNITAVDGAKINLKVPFRAGDILTIVSF